MIMRESPGQQGCAAGGVSFANGFASAASVAVPVCGVSGAFLEPVLSVARALWMGRPMSGASIVLAA